MITYYGTIAPLGYNLKCGDTIANEEDFCLVSSDLGKDDLKLLGAQEMMLSDIRGILSYKEMLQIQ